MLELVLLFWTGVACGIALDRFVLRPVIDVRFGRLRHHFTRRSRGDRRHGG